MSAKERAVEFKREYAKIDGREVWADGHKWQPLYDLLAQSRGKADTIVIEAPQMLGDTYREFVMNLAAIAEAGLKISIKPGKRLVGRMSIGKGVTESAIESLVEETAEKPNGPAGIEKKMGRAVLRPGRRPPVVIVSYAPDEIYAQAELLVMLEKEIYKPGNTGREIEGHYETGPGTVDSFFEEWIERPVDLKLLEQKRLEIIEKGWKRFTFGGDAGITKEVGPKGTLKHRISSKDAPIDSDDASLEAVMTDLRERTEADDKFTCMICMEELKAKEWESVGFLGVDGMNAPVGKLKEFPYPVCGKCASLPRERLFGKVEENIHSYAKTAIKEMSRWRNEADSMKDKLNSALSVVESVMANGKQIYIPDEIGNHGILDATHKVKSLTDRISKEGHFVCVCCLEKRSEKHLETIGSHFPKTEGSKKDRKAAVYPICDKCSKMKTEDMTEIAERNMEEGKV